jgi:threonine dehydrogenase-like Zn-dependent dehydrogenase
MIESGRLNAEAMVSRVFALDEVADAFQAARDRQVMTGVLLNQR